MSASTSAAFASQRLFRLLLEALSRPGVPVQLPPAAPPSLPDTEWLLAAGDTLLDHEVSFAVTGDGLSAGGKTTLAQEVQRRTGARPASISEADFVFVVGSPGDGLRALRTGDLAFPDGGATLLWRVQGFEDGLAATLSGPGVDGSTRLRIGGVAAPDLALLGEINRAYPCGLDCFFFDGAGRVVGLPRTTRMVIDEADG
jgi:alpha-D-ribose 1-methylphosphonate 5-triphosphate synthase subunit PhnH